MGRTAGPAADQGSPLGEGPGDGINLCGFDHFLKGHAGKDGGKPFCQHAFPGAWRANQKDVVSACRRDLQGALGLRLSFYLGEIRQGKGVILRRRGRGGSQGNTAAQMLDQRCKIRNRIYCKPLYQRAFFRVLGGNINFLKPRLFRFQTHGKYAVYWTQLPKEGKLSKKSGISQACAQLAAGD